MLAIGLRLSAMILSLCFVVRKQRVARQQIRVSCISRMIGFIVASTDKNVCELTMYPEKCLIYFFMLFASNCLQYVLQRKKSYFRKAIYLRPSWKDTLIIKLSAF